MSQCALHSDFCEFCRKTCQHATRGVPQLRLTCIHAIVESRLGGPGQMAMQTMSEFTLFVDFCLIPLSKTCSFDVAAKGLLGVIDKINY